MKLRDILKSAAGFLSSGYGPFRPEKEVIPHLKAKGYDVRNEYSPSIWTYAPLWGIYTAEGIRVTAFSPKEILDSYYMAYKEAKAEAGLGDAALSSPKKPHDPAP